MQDLLFDLDEIARQTENSTRLSECWDDELYEYFIDCMTEYIMNSDRKSDLSDENAENYIPYNYVHCSRCDIRCYFGAYPQAIEGDDGTCLCELCLDEMKSKEKAAEKSPKRVKIKIIRK